MCFKVQMRLSKQRMGVRVPESAGRTVGEATQGQSLEAGMQDTQIC